MIIKNLKYTVLLSSVLLFSCTRESNFEEVKDPSQVAAKVDEQEITVHQVQQLLKSQVNQKTPNSEELPNIVLDQLIKQELLYQQAQKMKLDRDPDALLAIEAAKRKIIVDTYLRKVFESSSTDSVTETEIQAYFNEHPKFFGERKKFIYSQIAVQVAQEEKSELISQIEAAETIDSLITTIEDKQLAYKKNQHIQTSEQLPKVLLDPIYTLKEDDIGYLTMDDGVLILTVDEIEALPLSLDEARPAIQTYLYNEKRKEDIEQLISNLEDAARIEYVGDFKPID